MGAILTTMTTSYTTQNARARKQGKKITDTDDIITGVRQGEGAQVHTVPTTTWTGEDCGQDGEGGRGREDSNEEGGRVPTLGTLSLCSLPSNYAFLILPLFSLYIPPPPPPCTFLTLPLYPVHSSSSQSCVDNPLKVFECN